MANANTEHTKSLRRKSAKDFRGRRKRDGFKEFKAWASVEQQEVLATVPGETQTEKFGVLLDLWFRTYTSRSKVN